MINEIIISLFVLLFIFFLLILISYKKLKNKKIQINELMDHFHFMIKSIGNVVSIIGTQDHLLQFNDFNKKIESGVFDQNHFTLFLEMIKKQLVKKNNSTDSLEDINATFKKNYDKEVQELIFYKETLSQLLKSIVTYISSTTVPISNELAGISQRIADFDQNMKIYENEIKEKKLSKYLIEEDKHLFEDMTQLSGFINQIDQNLHNNIIDLNQVITKIYEKSKQIQDISEKVNVLSINTSIEASRAGSNGNGFKVIASEIKRLSEFAQKFVKEINHTIADSKILVEQISKEFISSHDVIKKKINSQQTGYSDFYSKLQSFFGQFESMYQNINLFIDSILKSTGKINPVVQLHEITVQEMENLELTIADYFDEKIARNSKVLNQKTIFPEIEFAKEKVLLVRKRLTTSRELDALGKVLQTFKMENKINLKRDHKQIEFF